MYPERCMEVTAMETRVILQDLPTSVHGFVYQGEDGDPVIVLNSRLNREQQQRTYCHEREHIRRGDMFDISYVEYEEA